MPASKPSARETILRIFDEQRMTCLDEEALRRLHAMVAAARPEARVSRSYIIRVVSKAGRPVLVSDPFAAPGLREPYSTALSGVLRYDTLDNAELTLRRLQDKLAEYRSREDRLGVASVRSVALLGKRRAGAASRRARNPSARLVKAEIAEWFTLWLYDPDSFFEWLALRKRSPEYIARFVDLYSGR